MRAPHPGAMDTDALYARFLARDAALDGQVWTGVTSTGIYCLMSCGARKPRRDRVRFFGTEAEARAAGFRPCLRCRPDRFGEARDRDRLEALLDQVHRDPAAFRQVADLAAVLGCAPDTLAERFRREGLPSPGQVLGRARILHAADLLAAGMGLLEAAGEAGFDSPSAFHDRFRHHLHLSPGAWRALAPGRTWRVDLPPGFRGADTLAYHGRDAHSACERVEGTRLVKGLSVAGRSVRLSLQIEERAVVLEATGETHPRDLHGAVLRMLGLHLDPGPFERSLAGDAAFRQLVAPRTGLRLPQAADAWESLVWAILGQQVNLAFAYALRRDLVARFGTPLGEGLSAHPGAERLAQAEVADLCALRLSRAKAETLLGAARAVATGDLDLEALRQRTPTGAETRLRRFKGIGPWTARYVLMRGLGFGDVVPVGDAALTLALQRHHGLDHRPDPGETEALLLSRAPWRSLAVYHLWASLKGVPA